MNWDVEGKGDKKTEQRVFYSKGMNELQKRTHKQKELPNFVAGVWTSLWSSIFLKVVTSKPKPRFELIVTLSSLILLLMMTDVECLMSGSTDSKPAAKSICSCLLDCLTNVEGYGGLHSRPLSLIFSNLY